MDRDSLSVIKEGFELPDMVPAQMAGLTLAYIGDCIYELVVRTVLIEKGISHVSELSKKATGIVRAEAQKNVFHVIEPELTEEELAAFKRGRNVKSSTSAKHASIQDYRVATGFEALMGYLYMSGRMDRIVELVRKGLEGARLL